jgi:hypothetical protein
MGLYWPDISFFCSLKPQIMAKTGTGSVLWEKALKPFVFRDFGDLTKSDCNPFIARTSAKNSPATEPVPTLAARTSAEE